MNEFRAPRWQSIYTNSSHTQTVGDAVLSQRGLPANGYNRWLGMSVLVRWLPLQGICPCYELLALPSC